MNEHDPHTTHEAKCALCGQRITRHGDGWEWTNAAILRITVETSVARGKDPMNGYTYGTPTRRNEVRALVCEMCADGRLGDIIEMQQTAAKQTPPQETNQ